MRKTQFLNVNHLSKNCVIIAEDPDTALPNVDKNSKITKINHKNKEPNKSFYQYMKKDYQPDIFPPDTQEHRLQKPRQNQASQYIYIFTHNIQLVYKLNNHCKCKIQLVRNATNQYRY